MAGHAGAVPSSDGRLTHKAVTPRMNLLLQPMQRRLFFTGISLIVVLRVILLLPMVLDFRNFAFRDLGSFQHIDGLIAQGLRPGLDFGFYYGLLGVLLQHLYFAIFGAGHWPTLGLLAIYMLSMLVFWNLLCRELGQSPTNFGILAGLCSLMIWIVPWPPGAAHVLMELSMAYSLYFALMHRYALALLAAAMGALAIPSLPIVLAGLLALAIAWEWWQTPGRTVRGLLRQYTPAAVAYTGVVVCMAGFFGWRSVLPSLGPWGGAASYRAVNYGFLARGRALWYPPHSHLGHYVYTSAGIWLFCSALLVIFGCAAAVQIARTRTMAPRPLFVLICCAVHLVFVFVAFGNPESISYYSLVLCAGVVAGISDLTNRRMKIALSSLLLCFGLLSEHDEIREGLNLWKNGSISAATDYLYAPNDFLPEWQSVLSLAGKRRVFVLAYGTGVDLYYPQIGTAQSWELLSGVLKPREYSLLLEKIRAADVVVEKLPEGPALYDKGLRDALGVFPLKVWGRHFQILTKDRADQAELLRTATFQVAAP